MAQENQTSEENFESIELTKEEIEFVLRKAKQEKRLRLETEAYWQKVNNPPPVPKLSADALLSVCIKKFEKDTGTRFIVDDHNRIILELIAAYFTGDPLAEESGLSLQKGLLLQGNVGCGKTTIIKLFRKNPLCSFHVISCRQIASQFSEQGYSGLEPYFEKAVITADNPFRQEAFGFCFDDLGTETQKSNFGNKSNTMEEIILNRYDRLTELASMTHMTTNLSTEEIEAYYGPRVRSRMREMFNLITFDTETPDRRK